MAAGTGHSTPVGVCVWGGASGHRASALCRDLTQQGLPPARVSQQALACSMCPALAPFLQGRHSGDAAGQAEAAGSRGKGRGGGGGCSCGSAAAAGTAGTAGRQARVPRGEQRHGTGVEPRHACGHRFEAPAPASNCQQHQRPCKQPHSTAAAACSNAANPGSHRPAAHPEPRAPGDAALARGPQRRRRSGRGAGWPAGGGLAV